MAVRCRSMSSVLRRGLQNDLALVLDEGTVFDDHQTSSFGRTIERQPIREPMREPRFRIGYGSERDPAGSVRSSLSSGPAA
jgi:hypothetical protein